MTAFRLLGLGILLACAWVLGVEIWAYEPDTGVREESTSLVEVRRTGTVRAPMLVTGVRVAPYIGGQEAPVGLSAGEVTDTVQDKAAMAGELELARWSRETPGDGSASVLATLPPPAAYEPDRTGSERSERSSDGPGDVADGAVSVGDTFDTRVRADGPVAAAVGRMRNVRFTFYIDRGVTRWGCQAGPGIAATDAAVIPPMTRFRIVGWPGEWLACDTGSLVRGSHIDAWQPSLEAGRAFIRQMGESGKIEILRWGP